MKMEAQQFPSNFKKVLKKDVLHIRQLNQYHFLNTLTCYRKLIVAGWEVNRCETLDSKLSNSGIKINL
jgi:hypothetical protein